MESYPTTLQIYHFELMLTYTNTQQETNTNFEPSNLNISMPDKDIKFP